MAKGTKRKKAGVGVDFRRVKSKVGKKLPKAQNETNMTFKSRSINLPGQSVAEDKSGLAVSQRKLTTQVRACTQQYSAYVCIQCWGNARHICYTLQELLNQTSHYNERVRKDALTGLLQVFQQHPEEMRKQVRASMQHDCRHSGILPTSSPPLLH